MKVRSGAYVGDGVDDRVIVMMDITADFIIIKGSDFTRLPQVWLRNMGTNNTLSVGLGGGFYAGGIKDVAADEMVLGTNVGVNNIGEAYGWVAFQENNVTLFTYEGDGAMDRIVDLGITPDAVFIFGDNGADGTSQWAGVLHPPEVGDPENQNIISNGLGSIALDHRIQELNDCGLEIGFEGQVNEPGGTYYGMAFKQTAGIFALSSWTGTSPAPHSEVVGFQPLAVFVQTTEPFSFTHPLMFRAVDSGTQSWRLDDFGGGLGTAAGITSLDPTGFTVGTHGWVNENGFYMVGFAVADGELDEVDLVGDCAEVEPPTEGTLCVGLDISLVPDCRTVAGASRPVLVCRYGI